MAIEREVLFALFEVPVTPGANQCKLGTLVPFLGTSRSTRKTIAFPVVGKTVVDMVGAVAVSVHWSIKDNRRVER